MYTGGIEFVEGRSGSILIMRVSVKGSLFRWSCEHANHCVKAFSFLLLLKEIIELPYF